MTELRPIQPQEAPRRVRVALPVIRQLPSTQVSLSVAVFSLIIAVYFAVPAGSIIRTFLYVVPFLFAAESFVRVGGLPFRSAFFPAAAAFAFFAIWMIAQMQTVTKDAVFIGASLFCAGVRIRTSRTDLVMLTSSAAVVLIILAVQYGTSIADILSVYGARSHQGDLESGLGVAMGPIIIAAYRRKWLGLALVALVLAILFGKRSAVLAIFIGIFVDLALQATRAGNTPRSRAIGGTAFATVCALMGLNAVELYQAMARFINANFHTRVDADYFSSGRYYGLRTFSHYLDRHTDVMTSIFGHGMGYSVTNLPSVLTASTLQHYALLHDDWLRVYADFGYVGILGALIGMGYISKFSRLNLIFAVYTSILFITENTLGYFYYWFIALVCLSCAARGRKDAVMTYAPANAPRGRGRGIVRAAQNPHP